MRLLTVASQLPLVVSFETATDVRFLFLFKFKATQSP